MMPPPARLTPVVFSPVFEERVWGGDRLARIFGKALPSGRRIGESWEVADCEGRGSRIAAGPFQGMTLREFAAADPPGVLGAKGARYASFPLLFKLIDASDILSVQVHPSDGNAPPGKSGKSEAWVVLVAEPGARIVRGLKVGTDRDGFLRHLERGTVGECLTAFPVKAGDVIDLPPGVVHALGSGIVVAEIQQSSDETYRLYDWGRVGLDGKPRPLHVEAALRVMRFDETGPDTVRPARFAPAPGMVREDLVANDYFVLSRWEASEPVALPMAGSFRILFVMEGACVVSAGGGGSVAMRTGESGLVPAGAAEVSLHPAGRCRWLLMHLP
ncbi:MAG: type I phosphomannose isomerase catalytic subunit [Planctomycetota bacterium]